VQARPTSEGEPLPDWVETADEAVGQGVARAGIDTHLQNRMLTLLSPLLTDG
jgi:hypothetical protein